jgi:hypothetical protein
MNLVFVSHGAVTWLMVGLIWTIQVVHYPLFASVGAESFRQYEAGHTRRMSRLLVLPASAEVVLAAAVFALWPDALTFAAGALLAAIWVMTAMVHAPLHGRLALGFDHDAITALTKANWWRTVAWTARGFLAAAIIIFV